MYNQLTDAMVHLCIWALYCITTLIEVKTNEQRNLKLLNFKTVWMDFIEKLNIPENLKKRS